MARLTKQFESAKTEWETPDEIYTPLHKEFDFSLDVAASEDNTKCNIFFTEKHNALNRPWCGVCWCNPPYGRALKDWVKKAVVETWNGVTTVMLIPVRSNTIWWHELCIPFAEIRFIKGRPKFGGADEGLPWPLAIMIFRGKPKYNKKKDTCPQTARQAI